MLGIKYVGKKIFGTANQRLVKKENKKVADINSLEEEYKNLSDAKLKEKTLDLKKQISEGKKLDDILAPAFAVVREAGRRVLGQRAHDVQLIGAIFLHKGYMVEMKTGEGKTLAAVHAAYLNALTEKGVHVVTVNDYLAKRDAEWMGQIYKFLGLTVGYVINEMSDNQRRDAYKCDVTYGTNNEFGFDYLRDNMKFSLEEMVQRPFNFSIVDEVDSILIDEARTPLIISGAAEDSSDLYMKINNIIPELKEEHYKKDEKDRNVTFTEEGAEFIEKLLYDKGLIKSSNLYDIANASVVHHLDKALSAHKLFQKDVDYLVRDGKVYIIDEFTGRVMEGRRYSDGLHQALEAKENVHIQQENQTLASITYQNYFRMYPKLSGMSGTVMTEASEFGEIYGCDCVEIPTNKPVIRKDYDDEIYRTAMEKYDAIADLIKECHEKGQPVLVGTISIEKSEYIASVLKKKAGITPQVLNAKYHEKEAFIVAQAGTPGAVTIATNMAGRGTDIQLGGNPDMIVEHELKDIDDEELKKSREKTIREDVEKKKQQVLDAGGLYIIGTERHESRRIDNQLRGRSGRQGDPGASKFFLSLEDDLMRIFGGERLNKLLVRFGFEEGEAIKHPWVSKALERAQKKVEARNFDIRKNLLKYDDAQNDQRKVVYDKRMEIMKENDIKGEIDEMRRDLIEDIVYRNIPDKAMPEDWNANAISMAAEEHLGVDADVESWVKEEGITEEKVFEKLLKLSDERMEEQEKKYNSKFLRVAEKSILLQTLDKVWKEHLSNLTHLRKGIGLRAYGQKDPLNEYKKEALTYFKDMLYRLGEQTITMLSKMDFSNEDLSAFSHKRKSKIKTEHEEFGQFDSLAAERDARANNAENHKNQTFKYNNGPLDPNDPSTWGKVSRNEPCPCGSGKKYKHCHGKLS